MIAEYQNGNTAVQIFEDGTKIREWPDGEDAKPEFPESADVKITNYCDNPICERWCHEMSNKAGTHADLGKLMWVFDGLPKGFECAIGGGNTLSHPWLPDFLEELRDRGIIANITVSQFHLMRNVKLLRYLVNEKLVHGIGVSRMNGMPVGAATELSRMTQNMVWHVIAGIHTVDDVRALVESGPCKKVLILGYKNVGNGPSYAATNERDVWRTLAEWSTSLPRVFVDGAIVSFDNLALQQTNARRHVTDEAWNKYYQGEDGSHTMFVDLVKREFATSSTSTSRHVLDVTLREAFGTCVT